MLLLAGVWAAVGAMATPAAPRLTIVDGEATVVEGDRALVATEGHSLADEALVRTTARATLVRVEWPDGRFADLGPDTQAMVQPGGFGTRAGRPPALYLLRGWAKLGAAAESTSAHRNFKRSGL